MSKSTLWTEEEIKILKDGYANYESIDEISKKLPNRTKSSIFNKAQKLGLPNIYIRQNSSKFRAIYQDYEWCYNKYINQRMSYEEMAKEAGCTKRVIEKWCGDIHKLNSYTIRKHIHLTDLQKQIIMFGTLGDGHISKMENQPIYIESHSENEKEYLYWKYSILSNLCNMEPSYTPEHYKSFGTDKQYLCQGTYRMCTKIIDELIEIREMSRLDKIKKLNEFGLCLHILDDGSRSNLWSVCLAEWSQEEMDEYQKKCTEFGLCCKQNKDKKYYYFDAISSNKIDKMILKNIPNDLDIIQKKIINNEYIVNTCNYKYVLLNDGTKQSLSKYCKTHSKQRKYDLFKNIFEMENKNEMPESVLLEKAM